MFGDVEGLNLNKLKKSSVFELDMHHLSLLSRTNNNGRLSLMSDSSGIIPHIRNYQYMLFNTKGGISDTSVTQRI